MSKDEPGHVHQWKRWPVIDLDGISYQCADCGEPERLAWAPACHMTVRDMDWLLIEKRGGVFAGEMRPPGSLPSPRP